MTISKNTLKKGLFFLVLCLMIVRPHPKMLPSNLSTYLFDYFFIVFIAVWLLYSPKVKLRKSFKSVIIVWLGVCLVLYFTVLSSEYHLKGGINATRFLIYILYMVFIYKVIIELNITVKELIKLLEYFFFINFVIVLVQTFNPPLLGQIIYEIFGDNKLRTIWGGYPRVYGSFSNANWFGVYLCFMTLMWFCIYAYKDRSIKWLLLRISPVILLFLLSGSRTGMIGTMLGLFAHFIFQSGNIKRNLKALAIGAVVGVAATTAAVNLAESELIGKTIQRFMIIEEVSSGELSEVASVAGRLDSQIQSIQYISERPVLGYGDSVEDLIPHNSFLMILLSFGLVGFVVLGIGLFATFYALQINIPDLNFKMFHRVLFLFSISFAAIMMVGDFVYTSQVMVLYILLISVLFSIKYNYKKPERT